MDCHRESRNAKHALTSCRPSAFTARRHPRGRFHEPVNRSFLSHLGLHNLEGPQRRLTMRCPRTQMASKQTKSPDRGSEVRPKVACVLISANPVSGWLPGYEVGGKFGCLPTKCLQSP